MLSDLELPIGDVEIPSYTSTAFPAGVPSYDAYMHTVSYKTMSGMLQLPIAGPPGSGASIVRTHAPYTLKIVEWVVQVTLPPGQRPVLPHWDTGDPNEVCCFRVINPQAPLLSANGVSYQWRVEGEYRYYLLGNPTVFSTGSTPLTIHQPSYFTLSEGNFSRDISRSDGGSVKFSFAMDVSIR